MNIGNSWKFFEYFIIRCSFIIPFCLVWILAMYLNKSLKKKFQWQIDSHANIQKISNSEKNQQIIIVKDISEDDFKNVIDGFCKLYETKYQKIEKKNNWFIITLPDDADFGLFCGAINYLTYPNELGTWKIKPKVFGRCTLYDTSWWRTLSKQLGKKIMAYIPEDDNEYDFVCITTKDNKSFKLSFQWRSKAIDYPILPYRELKI